MNSLRITSSTVILLSKTFMYIYIYILIVHRAILGRRSDKMQRRFTAVSNEVDGKCVLNLGKRKQYSNKTSMRWSLYQSSQPWFHLCGVITAGFQDYFHNDMQCCCSVLHAESYEYVGFRM